MRHLRSKVKFLPLGLVLTCFFIAGCAGYQLGPTSGLARLNRTVQVKPFANQTLEPRLTDAVSAQLRKQLQRDGTYQLATHDEGDLIVSGTITRYLRRELSFNPGDTLTVRDYRISMTAQVTARERSTGRLLLDKPVTGNSMIRVGADLSSAERQALPLVAADLAQKVTSLLADGTW